MARKKKELPLLEQVTITDVAAEGKAIARVNDLVVFKGGSILSSLWYMWRLRMADTALLRAAEIQAKTGG